MNFGTIGAGAVALAFAREALARGHEVVLSGRRGGDVLAHKVAELGHSASATSVEAAASLDYVLLAVPWRNVESALKSLPAWNGRVLRGSRAGGARPARSWWHSPVTEAGRGGCVPSKSER